MKTTFFIYLYCKWLYYNLLMHNFSKFHFHASFSIISSKSKRKSERDDERLNKGVSKRANKVKREEEQNKKERGNGLDSIQTHFWSLPMSTWNFEVACVLKKIKLFFLFCFINDWFFFNCFNLVFKLTSLKKVYFNLACLVFSTVPRMSSLVLASSIFITLIIKKQKLYF